MLFQHTVRFSHMNLSWALYAVISMTLLASCKEPAASPSAQSQSVGQAASLPEGERSNNDEDFIVAREMVNRAIARGTWTTKDHDSFGPQFNGLAGDKKAILLKVLGDALKENRLHLENGARLVL